MNKAGVDFLVKQSLLEWLTGHVSGSGRDEILRRRHVYHLAYIEAVVVIYLLLLLPVWRTKYRHVGPWHGRDPLTAILSL